MVVLSVEVDPQTHFERINHTKSRRGIGTFLSSKQMILDGDSTRIGEIELEDEVIKFWRKQQLVDIILQIGKIASDCV